ncbi:MAG: phosphoserine phosphatase SerB [Pseudomonadota bacterium]
MPIASLIAKPERLTAESVEELRRSWRGAEWLWLNQDEAAEFEVPIRPSGFDAARVTLGAEGIDLNILPDGARRKKLLIADMDSTMIAQECIDEMAEFAGIGAKVRGITARAMNGELNFEEAMAERVSLVEGLKESDLEQVFENQISFVPGGKTLLSTMKAAGAYTALVSGGFTFFTERVAAALGFDEHRANTLLWENGRLTGNVQRPILGQDAKVEALEELTDTHGIGASQALAVGDGANDLGMLGRAGLGVALHAKPAVQAQCDVRINHGDLTALLYLQGYGREDFC